MKRWEIRRHIEQTHPFDAILFVTVLVEKLMDAGVLSDAEFLEMLSHQQGLAEQIPHYE